VTTARSVITGTLTFHLNRLAPGETLDPDTAATCLGALNAVVDEFNGAKSFLFREIFTVSTPITGTYGTLGVDWAGLVSGDEILGATVRWGGLDVPLNPMTPGAYADVPIKTLSTVPGWYAHDGAATVYLYPAVTALVVTLRTKQVVSDFADLDTDYSMPKGYKANLQALLAEKLAPSLGGSKPEVLIAARRARHALRSQTCNPAIVKAGDTAGPVARIKRGY
jgi:hypothetical protein